MAPTCTLVFEIPELAGHVVPFLSPRSISNLMQTSRQMHATMEPWFYRNLITVHDFWKVGLWQSPESLTALARSFHHTKRWETDLYYLVHFFHATTPALVSAATTKPALEELKQGQEPQPLQEKEREGNDPSTSPTHSSPLAETLKSTAEATAQQLTSRASTNTHIPVSLPPMTLFTKLDICLESEIDRMRSAKEFDSWSRYSTVDYLCATLARLPCLRELSLRKLSIRNAKNARAIALTLRKMTNLTHLRVFLPQTEMTSQVTSLLLFGCPSSIRSLRIDKDESAGSVRTDSSNESERTPATLSEIAVIVGKVRARGMTIPLIHLRDLYLWSVPVPTTPEDLYAVFGRCPNVENLHLHWQFIADTLDGARVAKMCPKIRNITYGNPATREIVEEWPYKLLRALPEHQLETFRHHEANTPLEGDLVGPALMRHSRSLRDIWIQNRITSKTVRIILECCEALEALSVQDSTVDLEDAIAGPWACSRISVLKLDIETMVPRKPLYRSPPPSRRSAQEQRLFDRLEIFYRQIGKLTNLRYLHLGNPTRDSKKRSTEKRIQPFPGLLRLGDKEEATVPGYLELLSGLTRLKEIHGSVAPETPNRMMEVDAKEVDWILEHWPEFAEASFFPKSRMKNRHRDSICAVDPPFTREEV
ncbi:hypothetical protein K457DRAFT_131308 [Linnemannia elongata AG-77]|uniref:F-box domain-containing protein n=1 Tax=Linnemannia elongata AG-77 TaxID=1314771 RepID=A0A197JD78_9FUNG|nr:hypothetical protein K457DRAFT_131308 [Linnemannia elongata AG-77]